MRIQIASVRLRSGGFTMNNYRKAWEKLTLQTQVGLTRHIVGKCRLLSV